MGELSPKGERIVRNRFQAQNLTVRAAARIRTERQHQQRHFETTIGDFHEQ